jgi:Ca2+:H+ antiporter
VSLGTAALFLAFGKSWLADLSNAAWLSLVSAWLLAAILSAAFAVVRHAEGLAQKFGEPLGTLVLTLSVVGIEVMLIAAVMYTGEGNDALARDAMFAVVMIVMNGMVGLSLILGGLRYHGQTYNLQGANAFLAVIVPLAVLGLVLPTFTETSPGPTFSPLQATFLIAMSIALYGVFLAIQNLRHRDYFVEPEGNGNGHGATGPTHHEVHSIA